MSELVVERCVDSEEMRRSEVQAYLDHSRVFPAFCLLPPARKSGFRFTGRPSNFHWEKRKLPGKKGEIDARS